MYDTLAAAIENTVSEYAEANSLALWRPPLTAVISADDEKLKTLKEAVSPEHFTPFDILPGAKSVISFFIPFAESVVRGNIPGPAASGEWALAYIRTNSLIETINNRIEALLASFGLRASKIKPRTTLTKKPFWAAGRTGT